jgi:hypothetical protein
MAPIFLVLLLGAALSGCAAFGGRTEGSSGPVAWRVADVDIQAVGTATGVVGRSGPQEVYAFTLVLHETQGTTLTFTRLTEKLAL